MKTNIGHTEAAAGIAGLMKVILALQHREIPPSLHVEELNPHIAWADLPVVVPRAVTTWNPIAGRRIAGVSSFGFSGTNAHAVIEEAPPAPAGKKVFGLYLTRRDFVMYGAGVGSVLIGIAVGLGLVELVKLFRK